MKKWFQIFRFSRTEERGIIVLLSLIMVFSIVRLFLPYYGKLAILREERLAMQQFNQLVELHDAQQYTKLNSVITQHQTKSGLQHQTLQRAVYNRKKKYISAKAPEKKQVVNINVADTAELKMLKGIGGYFASRIVKYRDKLGGYHKKEQILEVYNINQEVLKMNEGRIVAEGSVKKLNINTASKEQLSRHPYLNFAQAQGIVNYRMQHGPYTEIKEIAKCVLIDADTYSKIAPYLTKDD